MVVCKKLGWNMYCTYCIHVFARLASELINKISAAKLSRKFIKSALLVGKDLESEENSPLPD